MTDSPQSLILDLAEWLADGPRAYDEVMEAWRSSCPRLTVWEDASALGLVACVRPPSGPVTVHLTEAGRTLLARTRGVDAAA